MRDGDGEGVLVDDAVPPAARHEDDVTGPAVRLDEVRVGFRLGVEGARPPVRKSTGDMGAHNPIYISAEARTFGYSLNEGINPGCRLTIKKGPYKKLISALAFTRQYSAARRGPGRRLKGARPAASSAAWAAAAAAAGAAARRP